MLKIGAELNIEDKFYQNTIVNKTSAEEIYKSSPNPKLNQYILNFSYAVEDAEKIQKLINYTVVTYLKTDKQKNLSNNIKRWKYTNKTINEYNLQFANHKFNTKAFDKMKDELVEMIFN